jgi:hypothetical protein
MTTGDIQSIWPCAPTTPGPRPAPNTVSVPSLPAVLEAHGRRFQHDRHARALLGTTSRGAILATARRFAAS